MRSALVFSIFAYDLFHPQIIDPGVCADLPRFEQVGLVLAHVSRRWRQVAVSSRSHHVLIHKQQGLTASSLEHLGPGIFLFRPRRKPLSSHFDCWRPAISTTLCAAARHHCRLSCSIPLIDVLLRKDRASSGQHKKRSAGTQNLPRHAKRVVRNAIGRLERMRTCE